MSDCSKIPYLTCRAATVAMRAIQRRYATQGLKGPTGAYLCGTCKRWHLTSRSGTQMPPWERARR